MACSRLRKTGFRENAKGESFSLTGEAVVIPLVLAA
jgi:hypothetical protein